MTHDDEDGRTRKIRALNDALRIKGEGGRIFVTKGVEAHGTAFLDQAVAAMRAQTEFSEDNDPYGEHDFGRVVVEDTPVLWKIDYYDAAMEHGSDDAADPERTKRVLTLFLAEEY